MWKKFLLLIIVNVVCFLNLKAQETTGSLRGQIVEVDSEPIPFANVVLKNIETNEVLLVYSQDNGYYRFLNLTPASYQLEITYVGYETYKASNIQVSLGKETVHDVVMYQSSVLIDGVTITSENNSSNSERLIGQEQIEQTPTIFRSIQELQRSNPENNLNSFQGASHRFNNLNIDGVATNDIIGFQEPASGAAGSQANGTPGSLSKTQPIGFGAIKQLSTKTAPFDVSFGNFNGANIDIITKNGTNNYESSIFGYFNNRATSGNKLDGVEIDVAEFSDYQVGFNTGGPLIKDKLFYFGNFEFARAQNPLINRPGSQGSNISLDVALQVRDHLIDNYDYDPGAFESETNEIQSAKYFVRFDYVIDKNHKLTFRNNLVSSFAENLEWSQSFFNFGNQGFRHNNLSNSAVLELKSNFQTVFNRLNVSFNRVEEGRTFDGRIFPHIQIASSSASRIFAGTYREASVFNSDFNTFQILDKLSIAKGDHSISGGFLFQYHDLNYGFLSAWNGRWEYSSVDNFLNDIPSRVRGVYNVNPALNTFDFVQSNPAASLGVLESAVFLQDKWSITEQLNLLVGARIDAQFLTRDLPLSPLISASENFSHFTNRLENNYQVNPRVKFEYDIADGLSISAGTGLFSGRLPYLWFAYIDYISGTDYFNIDIRPEGELPLTENLNDLTSIQPGITEINLLDPDFKYPRDWKTYFGISWTPLKDWSLSFDFTYTNVMQGLLFQSINRNEVLANFNGADNRLFYNTSSDDSKVNENFTNVFLLTNTDKGYRYNATLNVERKTADAIINAGYSYGVSKDISSTVRSSPAANYEWNQAIFGNDPELSFSNYDLRHKVTLSYMQSIDLGKNKLNVSMLYNGRSGSPYSIVYQGDLNRDGSSRNDLVYVPGNAGEIELVATTNADGLVISPEEQWQALDNYIKNNDYLNSIRGDYAERNAAKTPWNHSLDGSLSYDFKYIGNNEARLRLDMFNMLNLINSSWGKQLFVPNVVNSSFSLLKFQGVSDENVPQLSFDVPENQTPWVIDNLNSRWQMQIGVELSF